MKERFNRTRERVLLGIRTAFLLGMIYFLPGDTPVHGQVYRMLAFMTSSGKTFEEFLATRYRHFGPRIIVTSVHFEPNLPLSDEAEKIRSREWLSQEECKESDGVYLTAAWVEAMKGIQVSKIEPGLDDVIEAIRGTCPDLALVIFGPPALQKDGDRGQSYKDNRAGLNRYLTKSITEPDGIFIAVDQIVGDSKGDLRNSLIKDRDHFNSEAWGLIEERSRGQTLRFLDSKAKRR